MYLIKLKMIKSCSCLFFHCQQQSVFHRKSCLCFTKYNIFLVINSHRDTSNMCFVFYSHFDLEYQETCSFDSLCVYGVKFCGSWLAGRTHNYILTGNSNFTIVLKTDGSLSWTGFHVRLNYSTDM